MAETTPEKVASSLWEPNGLRPKFGQAGDFWARYNKIADDYDKDLSKNLNGNLDVLLIF
ncbi:hypothetical protein FRB90_003171, partial [Tulasnella sp. 427]